MVPVQPISPLYSINGEVVFYRPGINWDLETLVPKCSEESVECMDIFGRAIAPEKAVEYLLLMADFPRQKSVAENALINIQVGSVLLALWREYVVNTGVHGRGLSQMTAFSTIGVGLLLGCLGEVSDLILAMPNDEVIDDEIKARFSKACKTANRM